MTAVRGGGWWVRKVSVEACRPDPACHSCSAAPISFTHTVKIDWMLPHVKPTGRRVEVACVVVVGVDDDKIAYEHIYWDQATVLVQIGLLDPAHLPVAGAAAAAKVLDPTIPGPHF